MQTQMQGPAAQHGKLNVGDVIFSVDGQECRGMTAGPCECVHVFILFVRLLLYSFICVPLSEEQRWKTDQVQNLLKGPTSSKAVMILKSASADIVPSSNHPPAQSSLENRLWNSVAPEGNGAPTFPPEPVRSRNESEDPQPRVRPNGSNSLPRTLEVRTPGSGHIISAPFSNAVNSVRPIQVR